MTIAGCYCLNRCAFALPALLKIKINCVRKHTHTRMHLSTRTLSHTRINQCATQLSDRHSRKSTKTENYLGGRSDGVQIAHAHTKTHTQIHTNKQSTIDAFSHPQTHPRIHPCTFARTHNPMHTCNILHKTHICTLGGIQFQAIAIQMTDELIRGGVIPLLILCRAVLQIDTYKSGVISITQRAQHSCQTSHAYIHLFMHAPIPLHTHTHTHAYTLTHASLAYHFTHAHDIINFSFLLIPAALVLSQGATTSEPCDAFQQFQIFLTR